MLWLKRNPLKAPGAAVIAAMLQTNRTIYTLDLDNTGLLDEGGVTVLSSLAGNGGALRHLFLNSNGFSQPTADAIAACLNPPAPSQCPLLSLSVGVNRFGDAGAETIAAGLRLNTGLTRLSLASNRIGPIGCAAIAKAVAVHPTLASLNLGFSKSTIALGELGNFVGDSGAEALAVALSENRSLRELDLANNGITEKGLHSFMTALRGGHVGNNDGSGGGGIGGGGGGGNTSLVTLNTRSFGTTHVTLNGAALDELNAMLEHNLKACSEGELQEVAEAHMPKHVRDIYSVYRVA